MFNRAGMRDEKILDRIDRPSLKWSFTVNHAHYDPAGIRGFVEGMEMSRCGEVRVADNNGLYELHMHPGTGTVDFVEMFRDEARIALAFAHDNVVKTFALIEKVAPHDASVCIFGETGTGPGA